MNLHGKAVVVLCTALIALCASAQASVWVPTAAGTTYDWNVPANWDDSSVPNGQGAVANLSIDLAGAQTVRLQANTTVGTMSIGDTAATQYAMTVSSGTGTNTLTFQGAGSSAAQLNVGPVWLSTVNTISAPISLASDLNIASAGQGLATGGTLAVGSNNLKLTGGTVNTATWAANGDITGDGTITVSATGGVTLGSTVKVKSFTGTYVLNSGMPGSTNSGTLTCIYGSAANGNAIVNGYITGSSGPVQNGGSLWAGSGSSFSANPGQRLPSNTITMNGGSLGSVGQPVSGTANAWAQGLEWEVNNVAHLQINGGYSLLSVSKGSTELGNRVNATSLEHTRGATLFVRSSILGAGAQFTADNYADVLIGAGGAAGTTTMSVVPWMVGSNTNGSAASSATFCTYEVGKGFRALVAAEMANDLSAAADYANMATSSYNISTAKTINSLLHNSSGTSGFNSYIDLTINSGALSFNLNNGGIGAAGDDTAVGRINFATAEGVVFSTGTNTNYIGAKISGSNGVSKGGSGTLVLTNMLNDWTGKTVVGSGMLQLGNGTDGGALGSGDVDVFAAATLKLTNGLAIADSATVSLIANGLWYGKMDIAASINETVGGLVLGGVAQTAGTYGATGSGADNINDTYFAGTGILTVVPEPGTLVLLALGGLAIVRRRAR